MSDSLAFCRDTPLMVMRDTRRGVAPSSSGVYRSCCFLNRILRRAAGQPHGVVSVLLCVFERESARASVELS
jgi:hypothetical protein